MKILIGAAIAAVLSLACAAPSFAMGGGLNWVPSQKGSPLPRGAVYGGDNGDGTSLYVCRANYNGGTHPGKLYAGNCNIGWGGKEIVIGRYEVLVGSTFWDAPTPGGGIVGGDNGDRRTPLVICRVAHRGGQHPGKLLAGKCNFGWGGQEIVSPTYQVLYPN